jgi:hypothetical protein
MIAAVALAISPNLAKADVVYFTGSTTGSDPVSYSGSITVTPGSGTSATVQVSLTNTTSVGDAVQYGYITGFGFNVPGSTTVAAGSASATDTDFKFLTAAANTTSLQAGEFSYAWSTNSSQLHTVATSEISKGLAAGQTATFTVTLNNAAGLTAAAIAAATQPAGAPFSVRFRSTKTSKYQGHNSPDGDKVPFTVTPSSPPPSSVPAPAGLVLGLIGAGCFIGRKLITKS